MSLIKHKIFQRNKYLARVFKNVFNFYTSLRGSQNYLSDSLWDNNWYGITHNLKKHLRIKGDLNAYIEHGLFFGRYTQPETTIQFSKKVIGMGPSRSKIYKNSNLEYLAIGPYIQYADEDSNFFKEICIREGYLLVFLPHSSSNYDAQINLNKVRYVIEKVKGNREVLVSVYGRDTQNNEIQKWLTQNNYKHYTCGFKKDILFLGKQKSMIMNSSLSISFSVGTHIGYCTYLDIPHWIFNLDTTYENKEGKKNHVDTISMDRVINESIKIERQEILEAYSYSENIDLLKITELQIKVAEYYWGVDITITSSQLISFNAVTNKQII